MGRLPASVAVLGAGTMGAGIAAVFAAHGVEARLVARSEETLRATGPRFDAVAELLGADAAQVRSRITPTTDVAGACAGVELVVETIAEAVEPKREVLAAAEAVAAPDAIVVSNTSSLPLSSLEGALSRPERFAGFHWFNPPELVELVEVVGATATDPSVVEQLSGWTRALGKAPVVVRRDVPGFVANRLQYALLREAWSLVESGVCSYEDVDVTLTHGLGARWAAIGPFQTVDLAGLDIHLAVVKNLYGALSTETSPPAALEQAIADGAVGCKGGRGLLGEYDSGRMEELADLRRRMLLAIAAVRRPPGAA